MWQIRILLCLMLFPGQSKAGADELLMAEAFIDAFYTFESELLEAKLVPSADAERTLYYQAWAQAAHYEVYKRMPCRVGKTQAIVCAVTVTDDFGKTLGYRATDTFYLSFSSDGSGKATTVRFEGDDPLVFSVLYLWMSLFRAEIFEGPCKNMFDGGETPGACARAVAGAAVVFKSWWPF